MAQTNDQEKNMDQETILVNDIPMKQAKQKESKAKSRETGYDKETVLADFRLANLSRFLSITGRREVLTGKAKFGIFGDGKEIIQIAMAKQFRDGYWRSGYYRDQT